MVRLTRPSCCVNAAPARRRGRLGAPVSDRHRPPPAGEHVLAARRDGAKPPTSAIWPGRPYVVAALRAACRSETGAPSLRTTRSRGVCLLQAFSCPAGCVGGHAHGRFSRWGLERRCIPAEPRRFAVLCVAFRSKYTRYSSLTRLVSRAPRRSRRSREFHHRPPANRARRSRSRPPPSWVRYLAVRQPPGWSALPQEADAVKPPRFHRSNRHRPGRTVLRSRGGGSLDPGALHAVPPGRLGRDLPGRDARRLRGHRAAHGRGAVRVPDPDPRGPGGGRRPGRLHDRRELGDLARLLSGRALSRVPPERGGKPAGVAAAAGGRRGLPGDPRGERRALVPVLAGQPERRLPDDRSRDRGGEDPEEGKARRGTRGPELQVRPPLRRPRVRPPRPGRRGSAPHLGRLPRLGLGLVEQRPHRLQPPGRPAHQHEPPLGRSVGRQPGRRAGEPPPRRRRDRELASGFARRPDGGVPLDR